MQKQKKHNDLHRKLKYWKNHRQKNKGEITNIEVFNIRRARDLIKLSNFYVIEFLYSFHYNCSVETDGTNSTNNQSKLK